MVLVRVRQRGTQWYGKNITITLYNIYLDAIENIIDVTKTHHLRNNFSNLSNKQSTC